MIQVCSACGTRWNVRDKQRVWCPRCQGPLLAPGPDQTVQDPRSPASGTLAAGPQRVPVGYRWIAVRPGAGPGPRRRRRILSPTPRYPGNPGWSLHDRLAPLPVTESVVRTGPTPALVRTTLRGTAVVLAVAAVVHLMRYILLIVNRNTLLPPAVAAAGLWLGVLASVVALVAVITCAITLVRWLIARRAAVYAHHRREDPRSSVALWAGCLTPVINLGWASVFVIETATVEGIYSRLRRDITVWRVLWVLSTGLSIFAIATSLAADAQGIADNTMTTALAYVLAFAVVVVLTRVFDGFVRTPVDRPAHRWVVVPDSAEPADPVVPAGPADREPAA